MENSEIFFLLGEDPQTPILLDPSLSNAPGGNPAIHLPEYIGLDSTDNHDNKVTEFLLENLMRLIQFSGPLSSEQKINWCWLKIYYFSPCL